jgi:hypothetical protein
MEGTKRVVFSWNLLRYAYGAVLVLAGLDKLLGTDLIVYWPKYISPFVAGFLPVSTGMFLAAMGIVEIAVAVLLITKWPRIGGYLSVAWLALIAVNLLMLGYVDIAVRDVLLAVGALALAELTVAVEQLHYVKQTM